MQFFSVAELVQTKKLSPLVCSR